MKNNSYKNFLVKFRKKINSFIFKFKTLSFVKHILFFYLFITIIGSLFLFMPASQKSGVKVSYIDSLFTAASSFSDTGLATLTTATTWSYFGQAIIAVLILVGGIGWFALKIYFFNILFGRPLTFGARQTLAGERGSSQLGNTRNVVRISVTVLFIMIIISTFVLSLIFFFSAPVETPFGINKEPSSKMIHENPYHNISVSFRFGLFHAISGLNNAGFDIIGSNSLAPYYYNVGIQVTFIILFVIGGIGYPVIYDTFLFIKSKFTKEKFRWSLFTKVSMTAYLSISLIGLAATFALEVPKNDGFWQSADYGTKSDKVMSLIFNTMSTRNAGFSTMNMADLSPGTRVIYMIMMFIGSAPSSTAGGIRTTTIAIVIMGIWSKIRGKNSIRIFNRRIKEETVNRSYTVITTAMIIVILGSLILMSSWSSYGGTLDSKNVPFTSLVFETASAFGTTGLSTGITGSLSTASKLSLILIMFIGQLGVSSTLLVWDSKKNKSRSFKFVQEDITIG